MPFQRAIRYPTAAVQLRGGRDLVPLPVTSRLFAGCNKGAAVRILGTMPKEARYFGQAGKAGARLSVLTTSQAAGLNSGGRTPAVATMVSASFPQDRYVMFL